MQFCPCFMGSELPIDRSPLGVADAFIGVHLLSERRHLGETATETLALQNTERLSGNL